MTLLLVTIVPAEQKNWKCKKRGPKRTEYCHLYKGGMRELRMKIEIDPKPTETETRDFWRSPGLRAALHTPA